jgi:TolB protein
MRALLLSLIAVPLCAQAPYPAARSGGTYMHAYYIPPAPSAQPWAPAWSPDGKWLAVSMHGSIWRIQVATGAAEELTHDRTYDASPDWSPDGRWIVYTADDDLRAIQLRVLDTQTLETRALTNDARGVYTDPAFSPDGRSIAYVSARPTGFFNVYVRSFQNGAWAGEEMAVTTDHSFGRERLYFSPWDIHITPAWLPGGRELLLVSNRDVPLGSGNVWRVPVEPNGMARGTIVLAEQTLYRTRPHVSLDGKRFIYSSTRGTADQFNNLYVQPTNGGEPYKLTFHQHDLFHPRWSPDGEWIAYISNEGGLPHLEVLETYGGARRPIRITSMRRHRPVGTLRVRVVDAAGATTPARIHLAASDGKLYAPADAFARISGVSDHLFHTPGTFSVDVPPGPVRITALKGFEHWPDSTTATVNANTTTTVTLRLRRMVDLSAKGWQNGSTHVHANYAGNLRNSLENLMFMSAAEDQDLVLEQIANKDNRVLDWQYFIPGGRAHPLSKPDRTLVVGQEYRPPFYGHVFMFGLRDHLISPFTTGYEGTGIESLYPSNTDMLRKAKAQGATTGYVHAFPGERDPLGANLGGGKGYIVDAALGTTDVLEWSSAGRGSFHPWYATLNAGLRVAAAGGEDAISSMHASKVIGSVRTYAYTGARGRDANAWFDALKRGRAVVTTGPLIDFTVNGKMPGDDVRLPAGGGTIRIEARVQSIVPVEKATLVSNGAVVEEFPFTGNRRQLDIGRTITVERSGWYHLRVEGGEGDRWPLDSRYPQAFTNPVWVTVGDAPIRVRAGIDYALAWIDSLQTRANAWRDWRSDREKAHVFAQFDSARAIYRARRAEAKQ